MKTIKDRLVCYIEKKGMTQTEFAKSIGKTAKYFASFKSPRIDTLDEIHRLYPDLSIDWLLYNNGSMLLPEQNLSENKTNLAKQTKEEERLFSTKEVKLILNKQREAMTEEFGKMIMDNMTHIINGQLELLKMQIKTQSETIQGQKDSIDKVLDKITGVEEKAGEIVKMVRKIG